VGYERFGAWGPGRGYTFETPASSFGRQIVVSTPDSNGDYFFCTSDSNYNDAKYLLASVTSLVGYHLPVFLKYSGINYGFAGQPYINKSGTVTTNQRKQIFKYYKANQRFTNPSVYVYAKIGNPQPLTICYELLSNGRKTASALIVSTPGFAPGWQTAATTLPGFATAGTVTAILSSAATNYWAVYNPFGKFRQLTYGTSDSYYYSDNTYDLGAKWYYTSLLSIFNGYVTEFSKASAVPGVKVELWQGATALSSAKTNNSGYYSAEVAADITVTVIPKKYDWEFTPSFVKKYATSNQNITTNFVQSSESVWWGHSANHHGKMWAFRQKVNFATPHPTLPVGYLVDIPIQTGNMVRIASSGYFNEAVAGGQSAAIVYRNGKTFCAWLSAGNVVNCSGATYDWLTETWTNHGIVHSGIGTWFDTHYYPNLWIDKSGYLYMARGGHNLTTDYLYITKTATAYDFTSFPKKALVGTVAGTTENTYPMIAYDENIDCTYIVYRRQAGDATNVYLTFFTKDSSGNCTIPKNIVRYNQGAASLYHGGLQVDKDGVLHLAWNNHDSYGADNRARAIAYAYSPRYPGSTAGNVWYNIWGHTVSDPLFNYISFSKDGSLPQKYSPYIIYSWSSVEGSGSANRYYHTNNGGMFIHPTKRINNGIHSIRAPYFTFHAYPKTDLSGNNINNLSDGYICFFDSAYSKTALVNTPWPISGKDTVLNGWVAHTVTSTAVSGTSIKLLKGRHYGAIMIDNADVIHLYGVVRPLGYANSDYWAGELWEWYSQDGHTFKTRQWTDKSSQGAGMVNFKKEFTNDAIEGLYCRGNDIIYISDTNKFPRMKENGNDIRIVYGGASSKASEINSLGNFYNYTGSHVYFPIQREINKNWTYDTAGNYYLYYGRYDTAQIYSGPNPDNPYRDPSKACVFFDNFETYQEGCDIATPVGIGYALRTSATSLQYVKIPNHTTLNFTATTMSISCWIKTTNVNASYIVSKPYSLGSPTGVEWGLGINSSGNAFLKMRGETFANTATTVGDGNWHHLAAFADGGYWGIYVDGNFDYTAKTTKPSNSSSFPIYIGADIFGGNTFGGLIDNLWIDRQIPDIGYLYSSGNGVSLPSSYPLLAMFNFDQNANDLLGRHIGEIHSSTFEEGHVYKQNWLGRAQINNLKDVNNIKIYSGYQNFLGLSTVKCYFQNVENGVVRVGHWNENDNNDCGVKVSYYDTFNNEKYVYINHNGASSNWRFLSSPWQSTLVSTALFGELAAHPRRMHEYIIYVNSTNGVSFQTEQNITFFDNNNASNLAFNKMDLHTINSIELIRNSGAQYFDFVRVYKTFSTPSPFEVF
jgi:hypothetical protein